MKAPAGLREGGHFLLTTGVQIERPIEAVFALIADPSCDDRWWPRVRSCRRTHGHGCEVGARFTIVRRPFPLGPAMRLQTEVIAREPPGSVRLRQEDRTAVVNVEYELEAIAGGTRLVRIERVDWKLPGAIRPATERLISRRREHRLRVLKFFLERIHNTGEMAGAYEAAREASG